MYRRSSAFRGLGGPNHSKSGSEVALTLASTCGSRTSASSASAASTLSSSSSSVTRLVSSKLLGGLSLAPARRCTSSPGSPLVRTAPTIGAGRRVFHSPSSSSLSRQVVPWQPPRGSSIGFVNLRAIGWVLAGVAVQGGNSVVFASSLDEGTIYRKSLKSEGGWTYLDVNKPVKVRNPTLFQRVRYFLGKVLGVILAALSLGYPIAYLVTEHFNYQVWGQFHWVASHLATLILVPIVGCIIGALLWYRLSGYYYTPAQLGNMRDWAFGQSYHAIMDKYGFKLASKFMTPRELRSKLLKASRDRGVDLILECDTVALYQAGMLLQSELETITEVQQALKEGQEEKQRKSNAIESEVEDLLRDATRQKDRQIAEETHAYETSSEVKLQNMLTTRFTERISELRRKRDKRLTKIANDNTLTAAEKTKRGETVRADYDNACAYETQLYDANTGNNAVNLRKRKQERDDAIRKVNERFNAIKEEVLVSRRTKERLVAVEDEYQERIGQVQRRWSQFVNEEMARNTSKIPDRKPYD